MGHLVFSGGALTADVVESEVRRSLEWLQRSQNESRRYAAVLILREMAENAPAVFNVHVRAFIDAIWSALRDPKIHVRDAGVSALSVSQPPLPLLFNSHRNDRARARTHTHTHTHV
jgi:FKBP12-rapamycin complex-associated protein